MKALRAYIGSFGGEDWAVFFFGASFFLGIWYALPLFNTYTDSWSYAGGVLRAMQAHTIFPGTGVEYGTLTFYLNYLAAIPVLLVQLLLNHASISMLRETLTFHPEYIYWLPRATGALVAAALLWLVYRFLKYVAPMPTYRLLILVLFFGNPLAVMMIRSGKMWVLSSALGIASFIYLYRALCEEAPLGTSGRNARLSIIAAFAALANFPLAGLYLINIPILWWAFPKTRRAYRELAISVGLGALLLLIVFALNAANIIWQISDIFTNYHPVLGASSQVLKISLAHSFALHLWQAIDAAALVCIAVIFGIYYGVRYRLLLGLTIVYMVVYFAAITYLATWNADPALYIRYALPLVFFSALALASFNMPSKRISIALLILTLGIYGYALALLSIPATYNQAYDYIVANYGSEDIRIDDHVFELTLPTNKTSFALVRPIYCASICSARLSDAADIAFRPIVITDTADTAHLNTLAGPDLIVTETPLLGCTLVRRFGDAVPDSAYVDVEHNFGRLLFAAFYTFRPLGKNIYIYEGKGCASLVRQLGPEV